MSWSWGGEGRGERGERRDKGSPVECAREDEVVVGAQVVESLLDKVAVVDQPAGLVDDDEGVHGPEGSSAGQVPTGLRGGNRLIHCG